MEGWGRDGVGGGCEWRGGREMEWEVGVGVHDWRGVNGGDMWEMGVSEGLERWDRGTWMNGCMVRMEGCEDRWGKRREEREVGICG